jgi:hypothetical protein
MNIRTHLVVSVNMICCIPGKSCAETLEGSTYVFNTTFFSLSLNFIRYHETIFIILWLHAYTMISLQCMYSLIYVSSSQLEVLNFANSRV